jgi:F-box protein 9
MKVKFSNDIIKADEDAKENASEGKFKDEAETPSESEVGKESGSKEDDLDSSSPLWSGAKDGWELSWPIWHLLPHHERKEIAHKHGYKTIGEFEEYMSLQQAFDNSEVSVSSCVQKPYSNEWIYGKDNKPVEDDRKPPPSSLKKDEDDEDDDNWSVQHAKEIYSRQGSIISSNGEVLTLEDLLKVGGKLLIMHDEILHKIFSFLPVDAYGTLALVSPHWKHLTRTEIVYKRLCERLYLNQSKRRELHVSRFGGSYRRMLEIRPRVRAAGGCYVLKYAQIKQIQRDMWTEVPVGAILESIYYRYLYFQENGRVLYALSSAPPHEMFRRLLKVVVYKTEDKAAVWGTYQVQKTHLTITARQEWHSVRFDLTIHPLSPHGRFAALSMDRHLSSPSNCFEDWSSDRVEYKVPIEHFRFVSDRRL